MLAVASGLWAQTHEVTPLTLAQGDVIHVHGSLRDRTARMNERTIRLFPQTDGTTLGLMPVPVNDKPGTYQLQILDDNGVAVRSATITVWDAHFPKQNIILSKKLTELKASPGEADAVATFRNTVSDVRYWTEPLEMPVSGCLTSPFGVRRLHNGKPTGDYHAGFDQRSPSGGPIRAITGGVVKIVRQYNLHGGTVAIDHGQGVESIYLHMSKFATTEGAVVKPGDVIGYVGSSGRSTAPHLHWSIYVNGVPVNPGLWVHVLPCAAPNKK